jgi:DNA-binding LacI/PurR family transcriptional regulator
MPLNNTTILILHGNAATAHPLISAIMDARGDVVLAESAAQALQRCNQFRFDAAVLDASAGADRVATELEGQGIPYCVCAQAPPEGITGPMVKVDQVVATLVEFLAR